MILRKGSVIQRVMTQWLLNPKILGGILLVLATVALWWAFKGIFHEADSLGYAFNIREGGLGMYHPHHLIAMPAVRWFWQAFGFSDILHAAQVHNLLYWIASVLLVYALALRLLGQLSWAVLAGISLVGAFDFIRYSLWVEVYVPATAWMLGGIYVLTLKRKLSGWQWVGVAFCWAMAILYHQSHVLWVVPLGVYAFATHQARKWGLITALSGFLVLTVYLIVIQIMNGKLSWELFQQFVFSYAYAPYESWGSLENLRPMGWVSLFNSQTDVFLHKGSDIFSLITLGVLGWHTYQVRKNFPVLPGASSFLP